MVIKGCSLRIKEPNEIKILSHSNERGEQVKGEGRGESSIPEEQSVAPTAFSLFSGCDGRSDLGSENGYGFLKNAENANRYK